MRNTFKVVFYINASKAKGGAAPIMGRVTVPKPLNEALRPIGFGKFFRYLYPVKMKYSLYPVLFPCRVFYN